MRQKNKLEPTTASGGRVGEVVRAVASHQCGPGSIPRTWHQKWVRGGGGGSLTSPQGTYEPRRYLWDGTYGLQSLSEKTWESNHLQMKLQRQNSLLSYFKILSIDPAGVRTRDLLRDNRRSTNWATGARWVFPDDFMLFNLYSTGKLSYDWIGTNVFKVKIQIELFSVVCLPCG